MLAVLAGLLVFSTRNRRRQVAEQMVRLSRLRPGDDVMTTSGLYGTVVRRNDDDTVQLAIAPGVEVKWALAALRDVESLPDRYRQGHDGAPESGLDQAPENGLDRAPERGRGGGPESGQQGPGPVGLDKS